MAVTVRVPTLLRTLVDGHAVVEANDGGTLRDVLETIEARYPGFKERFVNVYVNDEDVRYLGALDAEVREGDTVSILPAVAGG